MSLELIDRRLTKYFSFALKEVQRQWICTTLTLYAYMWHLSISEGASYVCPFKYIRLILDKYPYQISGCIFFFKRPYYLNKHAINFQTSMKIRTDYIFTSYYLLLAKRIPKFYKGETESHGVACQFIIMSPNRRGGAILCLRQRRRCLLSAPI